MANLLGSMKGRAIVALVGLLAVSHLLALFIYATMSERANNLLHDAHVAEQIATAATLIEALPDSASTRVIDLIDAPRLHIVKVNGQELTGKLPEGTRGHNFEHLLSAVLNRPIGEGIGVAFTQSPDVRGLQAIWSEGRDAADTVEDLGHVPRRVLEDIRSTGVVEADVLLRNDSWFRFSVPLLSVNPISTWRFGVSLLVGFLFVLVAAIWVVLRWTQPLTTLVHAAERLGGDINAQPLPEKGPSEVRAAANAFNRMQEKLRSLIEDRTCFAAAIAHDLGTPITRLRLRAEEIANEEQRVKFLKDLAQMQKMIGATLDFTRQDVAFERFEPLDLSLLLRSLHDEFNDMGHEVVVRAPGRAIVMLRPYAIRRALTNLIENATKYGKRAAVRLSVTQHCYTIIIEDDGPGVPEQMLGEIFKPFRRLAQVEEVHGAGLGLTVAQTIVRDHGGDIDLVNRQEGGLRVTVTLPRHRTQ